MEKDLVDVFVVEVKEEENKPTTRDYYTIMDKICEQFERHRIPYEKEEYRNVRHSTAPQAYPPGKYYGVVEYEHALRVPKTYSALAKKIVREVVSQNRIVGGKIILPPK